jgi:hypothetical protein
VGPIEPAAITAATLLATKALEALGSQAGERTWAGMTQLVALVRRKVTGHRHAETTLAQVQQHPQDTDRIRELGELLAAFAAQDVAFHREVVALLDQARRDPVVGQLATRVYGQAQVGQLVNVGQARDIYIQPPPPPAEPPPSRYRAPAELPPSRYLVANFPERAPVGRRVSLLVRMTLARPRSTSELSADLKPL